MTTHWGNPGGVDALTDRINAEGTWVGDEALFWLTSDELFPTTQRWALNPDTRTWRRFQTPTDSQVMSIGDLLLVTSEATNNDITQADLYRPPTTATG